MRNVILKKKIVNNLVSEKFRRIFLLNAVEVNTNKSLIEKEKAEE